MVRLPDSIRVHKDFNTLDGNGFGQRAPWQLRADGHCHPTSNHVAETQLESGY